MRSVTTRYLGRFLPRGELSRGVLLLVGGTTVAQGIAVLSSPILTRLYTPADLGALAVFTAILSILLTVTCLSYDFAIPLPDSDVDAANIVGLCLAVNVLTTIVAGVVLAIVGPSLLSAMGAPALIPFISILVLDQFVAGVGVAFDRWAIRARRFTAIAGTHIIQSGTLATGQIALGMAGSGTVGLLLADLLSKAAAAAALAMAAIRSQRDTFRAVTLAGMREAATRYRRFPLLTTPSTLINTLGLQAPTLLIVALYGAEVGGQFFLAQRVAALPMTLVARSVGQVYFSEAARVAREDADALEPLFLRTTRRLARTGSLPTLFVMIASPILFPPVFGAAWQEAGWFAAILAPMYFLTLVMSPTGATLNVLERQDLHLVRETIRLVLVAGAVVLAAAAQLPAVGAVIVLSVAGCVTYLLYGYTSWRAIRSHQARLRAARP